MTMTVSRSRPSILPVLGVAGGVNALMFARWSTMEPFLMNWSPRQVGERSDPSSGKHPDVLFPFLASITVQFEHHKATERQ
jgi:hypothetical protein